MTEELAGLDLLVEPKPIAKPEAPLQPLRYQVNLMPWSDYFEMPDEQLYQQEVTIKLADQVCVFKVVGIEDHYTDKGHELRRLTLVYRG